MNLRYTILFWIYIALGLLALYWAYPGIDGYLHHGWSWPLAATYVGLYLGMAVVMFGVARLFYRSIHHYKG